MSRFLLAAITIIVICAGLNAQPKLEIKPDNIKFENVFDRLKNIYIINKGDSTLSIDSIYYKADLYYPRFNRYWDYPLDIPPGDTVVMDCILSGYQEVTSSDTADTMYFYSNTYPGFNRVKIEIDFYDDNPNGNIKGYITDGADPVADATVNIMQEGRYITKSVKTNESGYYYAELPEGNYAVAAFKDSFSTVFYGQVPEPYQSSVITLDQYSAVAANINLEKSGYTGYRISGKVIDRLTLFPLKRAVVVIRRGRHNPAKRSALEGQDNITVFANSYGNFSANIPAAGYYYVQSFCEYYIPSYYSEEHSNVLWQQSDSIEINSADVNITIDMPRDSSFGGGLVEGKVLLDNTSLDSLQGILVFAESVENGFLYSYGFTTQGGEFRLTNLPYGKYRLFAQKMGYENSYSNYIEITAGSSSIKNIEMHMAPVSVGHEDLIPAEFHLYQNYPNPFNPSTTIEFDLPEPGNISLSLFNILGQEVKQVYNGYLNAGKYKNTISAAELSSGTYFIVLKTNTTSASRKILLLK